MEVGTFYEVYSMEVGGGDVDIVSNVCEIEKTRCNKKIITHKDQDLNVKNPYMCGFQSKSLNEYIQLLINKNYNVVLVKQKLINNKISRYVDSVITKSTFINDDIKSNNLLLCIYNNNEINYYCSIDLSTGINNIYTDDNNYIQILNPIEILYITNTPTNTNINTNNTNNDTNNTNNNTNNNVLNTNIKITNLKTLRVLVLITLLKNRKAITNLNLKIYYHLLKI
jgi:DNA mismatch repair ATPase MutS